MWLMTADDGFLSIVHKGGKPNEHCVRARCREDLERFRKKLPSDFRQDILAYAGTDYPFRMYVDSAALSDVVAREVRAIDYPNFKDAVTKRRGRKHHDVFMRIWSALLSLEPRRRGGGRKLWASDLDGYDDGLAPEPVDQGEPTRLAKVRCPRCSTDVMTPVLESAFDLDEDDFEEEISRYAKQLEGECQFTETLTHRGHKRPKRGRHDNKVGHAG